MFYCKLGGAYTYSRLEKDYDKSLYANTQVNYLPEYLSSINPLITNDSHFNGNFTLFGCRIGNRLAATFEFGFGYQGLVNLGLSYKL